MHYYGNARINSFFCLRKLDCYIFNGCLNLANENRNEYILKNKWCFNKETPSTYSIIYHIHVLIHTFICFWYIHLFVFDIYIYLFLYISSKSMPMQQKSTSQYVKEELRNICNARSEKHLQQQQQQQQQGMSQGLPPPPVSQTTPSTPQPPTSVEYSELPNYIIEQSKFCTQCFMCKRTTFGIT